MKTVLIKSKIKGIKNISKVICINYIKSNFDDSIFDDNHIKTIYGTNGVGKSAIIHAYDSYKYISLNKYPFKDIFFMPQFVKLLNNRTKEFEIENVVANRNNGNILRVSHAITVALNQFSELYIKKEVVKMLNSRLEPGKVIFSQSNGNITVIQDDSYRSFLEKSDLKNNSILSLLSTEFYVRHSADVNLVFNNFENVISACFLFANNIQITYGSLEDNHENFNTFTLINSIKENKGINSYIKDVTIIRSIAARYQGKRYLWIINNGEENRYKKLIEKLTIFLKLLKPQLKMVEGKFENTDGAVFCNLVFHYKDGDVDYEFESTGIKKLCALFAGLYNASKGSISFIDEIDSGLHDVFLSKLIEYFALYNDCQLIITTHHVGLMDVVKPISKSIDFITDNGDIKQWVKDGSFSPSSLYLKGNIEGLPFNLNAIEFSEVFGDNDD